MMNKKERHAQLRRLAQLSRNPAAKQAISEARLAANRENATHSTGPISDTGKAAVSQNRRVHGLNYNPATFKVLACEIQTEYDQLLQDLREEHKPEDITESLLIVGLAQHRWLLDRANRLQETCFDQETGQIKDQKLFSLYLRYATTHERAFHKCLNDLLKLRATRQKLTIGFESEKRKAERHVWIKSLDEMKFSDLQGKVMHMQAEQRRTQDLQLMEKAVEKAA